MCGLSCTTTCPPAWKTTIREAGRAGRDGLPAHVCCFFFSAQDVIINKFLLERRENPDVEEEDAALLYQRDLQRLQAMEQYCRTTACLRNTILTYFGEHPTAPCGSCGSCNNVYEQADLTDAAKRMINCVAELRGRFGKAVVFGTLQGANRARLRELGAPGLKATAPCRRCRAIRWTGCWPSFWRTATLYRPMTSTLSLRLGDITPLKEGAQVLVGCRPGRSRSAPPRSPKTAASLTA